MLKQDHKSKITRARVVSVKPKTDDDVAVPKALNFSNRVSVSSSSTPMPTPRGVDGNADQDYFAIRGADVTFINTVAAPQSPKNAIQSPKVSAGKSVFSDTLMESLRALQLSQANDTALQQEREKFEKSKVKSADSSKLKPPAVSSPKPAWALQNKEAPTVTPKLHPQAAAAASSPAAASSTESSGLMKRMFKANEIDVDNLPGYLAERRSLKEQYNRSRKNRLTLAGQLCMGPIASSPLIIEDPAVPALITGSGTSISSSSVGSGTSGFEFRF